MLANYRPVLLFALYLGAALSPEFSEAKPARPTDGASSCKRSDKLDKVPEKATPEEAKPARPAYPAAVPPLGTPPGRPGF